MTLEGRRIAWKFAERLLSPGDLAAVQRFDFQDLGYGYDPFGMERESAMLAYLVFNALHRHWFRVESRGIQNVPTTGPAILVPNHGGVVPIDGALMAVDVFKNLDPPRVVRYIVDTFAAGFPFVSTFLSRAGQVFGDRKNVEDLVRRGELVGLFPEGAKGTGKLFHERYRLRRFNVGFIEIALRHRVPIVPVSILGSEEQAPMLANLAPLARLMGVPYFPITPTFPHLGPLGLIPLPAKYHITYETPLRFYEEHPPSAADDPVVVRMLADKVQVRVQEMLDDALSQRESIFDLGSPLEPRPGGNENGDSTNPP
jgi:1-acyl-sn-glycerol-3-phosphate acyltransferase